MATVLFGGAITLFFYLGIGAHITNTALDFLITLICFALAVAFGFATVVAFIRMVYTLLFGGRG